MRCSGTRAQLDAALASSAKVGADAEETAAELRVKLNAAQADSTELQNQVSVLFIYIF
jgi:phage terminase Nu1 subunit (DNA packaging protein)